MQYGSSKTLFGSTPEQVKQKVERFLSLARDKNHDKQTFYGEYRKNHLQDIFYIQGCRVPW